KTKATKNSAGPFASRRSGDDPAQKRNSHPARNDMERATVISGNLTHARDVERPENAGKAPRRQHQSVNRPDVFRSKIIRRERWRSEERRVGKECRSG